MLVVSWPFRTQNDAGFASSLDTHHDFVVYWFVLVRTMNRTSLINSTDGSGWYSSLGRRDANFIRRWIVCAVRLRRQKNSFNMGRVLRRIEIAPVAGFVATPMP